MLEDEVLHEVVLGHALAAHGALVAGGFLVASEGGTPSGRGQTRNGSKQG